MKNSTLTNTSGDLFLQARSQFIKSQLSSSKENLQGSESDSDEYSQSSKLKRDNNFKSTKLNNSNSEFCNLSNNDDVHTDDKLLDDKISASHEHSVISISDSENLSVINVNSSSIISDNNNQTTNEVNVTKEGGDEENDDKEEKSLVKSRLKLFEKQMLTDNIALSTTDGISRQTKEMNNVAPLKNTLDDKENTSNTKDPKDKISNIEGKTPKVKSVELNSKAELDARSLDIKLDINSINNLHKSDVDNKPDKNIMSKNVKEEDYPEDLNPFGNDDKDKNSIKTESKSLNPFDEESDEKEENNKPTPKPRKLINPIPSNYKLVDNDEKNIPENLSKITISRISLSPGKMEFKILEEKRKKIIPAARVSLNPFWSDEEENQEKEKLENDLIM